MKALFVHDHKFRKINGKIYSSGGLPQNVLNRYTQNFGELTVVGRVLPENAKKTVYSEITDDSISFIDGRKKKITIVKRAVKNADIIIIRLPSILGIIAVFISKLYKKKYILEVVGSSSSSSLKYSGKKIGIIAAPIMTVLMKVVIWNAKDVIYVSRWFLQKEYPTKGNWVGCPDVYLDEPDEIVLGRRIERIKTMEHRCVKLGLIGSLDVNYRGQFTLLKVGKRLKEQNYKFEIHFLGGGSTDRWERIAREYQIEGRVFFDGTLPAGDEVFKWIDNIDILVMPAKQETLGRAIIEAMSRGCPVIGSIETAIGEQIGSDCLASSDDDKEIYNIICRMLEDKTYMMSCAKENFYRSFKYTNSITDNIRNDFFKKVIEE